MLHLHLQHPHPRRFSQFLNNPILLTPQRSTRVGEPRCLPAHAKQEQEKRIQRAMAPANPHRLVFNESGGVRSSELEEQANEAQRVVSSKDIPLRHPHLRDWRRARR